MQYALLIYAEPGHEDDLPEEERAAARAGYEALADDPRYVRGTRLGPAGTATSVRVAGGRTLLTDGPFADTKEVLGGICLIEAADLGEAIEVAAGIPAARHRGVVEVRPLAAGR